MEPKTLKKVRKSGKKYIKRICSEVSATVRGVSLEEEKEG